MHYVVLAYPDVSRSDYEWIQSIRKQHDKQFTMVEPHFTIVFPTTKLSESEILEHVKSIRFTLKPLDFTLAKAIVEENVYPKYFQVHLVAAEPIAEIIKLHDLLYVGALASELRTDVPYVPHITIASSEAKDVMQKLADKINSKDINISSKVNKITVSSFDGTKVVDIGQFQL